MFVIGNISSVLLVARKNKKRNLDVRILLFTKFDIWHNRQRQQKNEERHRSITKSF